MTDTRSPTPGPWSAEGITQVATNDGYYAIQSESGAEVVKTTAMKLANARLIAAAPCLLAALIECHSLLARTEHKGWEGDAAQKQARAAIAEARGESHDRNNEEE